LRAFNVIPSYDIEIHVQIQPLIVLQHVMSRVLLFQREHLVQYQWNGLLTLPQQQQSEELTTLQMAPR